MPRTSVHVLSCSLALLSCSAPSLAQDDWITATQNDAGCWISEASDPRRSRPVRTTAMMLLTLLGDGSTARTGPYHDQIRRGLQWLLKQQADTGLFGTKDTATKGAPDKSLAGGHLGDHAVATFALLTSIHVEETAKPDRAGKALRRAAGRPAAQRALQYLEASFHPDDDKLHPAARVFTTWCYLLAHKLELKLQDPSLQRIREWVVRAKPQNQLEEAQVFLIRVLLEVEGEDHAKLAKLAEPLLGSAGPTKDRPEPHALQLMFTTYGMYLIGRSPWKSWCKELKRHLARRRKPAEAPLPGPWVTEGGKACSVATEMLVLEAYYRYTRIVW